VIGQAVSAICSALGTFKDQIPSMDFLELKTTVEQAIPHSHELVEMHYAPYAFGSGFCVYKVKGRHIKLVYDGRDGHIQLLTSSFHEAYPAQDWTILGEGPYDNTWKLILQKLKEM
jgi:hypothetical protein